MQVTEGSFSEQMPLDTIGIDQAMCLPPFSIKALSLAMATVVDKSVRNL